MKNNIDLLKELTLSDFKLKYKNSILGLFWFLLKPLLLFLVLYLVFSFFIKIKIENYELYLLLGIMIWNYIAESTTKGMNSIITKSNLIKKTYFPRILVVLSTVLDSTLIFLLNMVVFFIFMLIYRVYPTLKSLSFIYLLIILFLFIFGLSLILSTLFVKFRDLGHLWEVLLQITFWFTPIVYSIDLVPKKYLFS